MRLFLNIPARTPRYPQPGVGHGAYIYAAFQARKSVYNVNAPALKTISPLRSALFAWGLLAA